MDSTLLVGVYLVVVSAFSALWVIHTPAPFRRQLARFASFSIVLAFVLLGAIHQLSSHPIPSSTISSATPTTTETQSASASIARIPPSPDDSPQPNTATIIRIIDGDTISVQNGGAKETIRLIGIDAPEKQTSRSPAECFGPEATRALTEMLPVGSTVTLSRDPTQDARDRYNRMLAYVHDAHGKDVGETLLRNGYAYEYVYRIPYQRHEAFVTAEKEARSAQKGLWSACDTSSH